MSKKITSSSIWGINYDFVRILQLLEIIDDKRVSSLATNYDYLRKQGILH